MSHEELASYQSVFNDIKLALEQGRRRTATHVNHEMLITYWNIGRIIVEHEQANPSRAEYGTATLRRLSRELTETYGKGFSVSNIQFMRRFYLAYEKQQTLSVKLSWSHYCELLIISDLDKRHFYECECIAAAWSVRELKRQIATSLYERRLLSCSASNPQRKLAPANDKSHALQPIDIIKDPYVFEFLGIPDNASLPESELERVLVELKTSKLMPEAVGQINMYLNYYAREMNDEFDNPPIGIILCTDKDAVTAEYALGGLQNAIFASRYVSHVPDKEQLVQQVERALMDWEQSESA